MYYNSINEKLKNRYGCKVYKLALSGGMSCPNRCIFCAEGSGGFAESYDPDISAQIERAKASVDKKIRGERRYIAYFQSYTNTYGPPAHLRNIFMQAINHPDIAILSVATRPDCLGDGVLEVLAECVKIKPVWIELGLQTVHKSSIDYIRRGYDNSVYEKAVNDLKTIGCEVITHVILGLPNETKQMMLETVKYAGKYSDGIKLQLLHVLKGTDLEKDYVSGKFETLGEEEYFDILCDCIRVIPKNVAIHRLTGDGDKRLLVSPLWSGNKRQVLNALNKKLQKDNVIQGEMLDIAGK